MKNFNYMNISILFLLLVSKLSSSFINISPFIATIILGSYFINSKYHLLIMICIAQFISDMSFGMHISIFFVYISYFCIVPILYLSEKNFSLVNSLIKAVYANVIFFFASNFGHFISFSEYYSLPMFFESYEAGMPFGINLLLSTLFFIFIYHALLAISNKQLVSSWLK